MRESEGVTVPLGFRVQHRTGWDGWVNGYGLVVGWMGGRVVCLCQWQEARGSVRRRVSNNQTASPPPTPTPGHPQPTSQPPPCTTTT
jgi:hypothetical protein